jgi:hypothetical protein
MATSFCRRETFLASKVQVHTSTPPSHFCSDACKLVASRRHQIKQRDSCKHVKAKRLIDWKLVDLVFEPLHARFDFTLEDYDDDEGLNSH